MNEFVLSWLRGLRFGQESGGSDRQVLGLTVDEPERCIESIDCLEGILGSATSQKRTSFCLQEAVSWGGTGEAKYRLFCAFREVVPWV
jgi:hypothetical protein